MNLEWHEWFVIIIALILLFCPAIGFWWAGYIWEKNRKETPKKTQEYYVATTDADEED